MANVYDVEGWEDSDGNRHRGQPTDPEDTFGEFIHVYDPDTGEEHHFWAFTRYPLDWDEWDDYIYDLCSQHGISLA